MIHNHTMMIVLTATLIAPALMATVQAAETTSAPAPLMTSKPLLEPAPPTESPSPAVQPPSSSVPVATPQSASPEHEVVMAWVGGKKITVEQFMNYIKKDTRLVVKATKAPGRAEILREMIVERLLEEAMLREDLLPKDRAPNSQEYMQAYQQLASRRFPQANIAPTEEEIYQYYRQYPEFFGIPGMVRVSQIQFRWPENASEQDKAAVRTKAEDALKRLQANAAFADVATELTENPRGKVAGGDLGFLQLDKDPWLQKAVANLKIGQFSGVLESPVGYEIVLLQEQREAMIAPYANVRDNALGRIRQEKHAKAREEYAWTLAKDFGVKVELPELKSAIPENLP